MATLSPAIKIVEVGPRDGLQNEDVFVPTAEKIAYIEALVLAGLKNIEVTAFVHPKAVPQMADAVDLVKQLKSHPGVIYSALVPNLRGLDRALEAGISHIAVFTAASETFNQRNINMTIAESIAGFAPVLARAQQEQMTVRGYVSTAFFCPYEGAIAPEKTREVTQRLLDMGVSEVSIGDTIGQAKPEDIEPLLSLLLATIPAGQLAMHFHDTNGMAIENVKMSLTQGIQTFDSSAGGLGGCPFAPGASGNLATEKLVAYLESVNLTTGVDLDKLRSAASPILSRVRPAC